MRKSINKTTVIIVLAIFLSISVGYALFSDTITIEGTATAQGTFDIEASCYSGIAPTGDYDFSSFNLVTEQGYSNDVCQVDDDKVSFSTNFAYPGSSRYFTVKLTNTGTIAAKVKMPEFYELSSVSYCVDGKNGEKNGTVEDDECVSDSGHFSVDYVNMVLLIKPDGTELINNEANLNEIMSSFLTSNGDVKLEPKASIYVLYNMSFKENKNYVLDNNFNIKGITTYKYNFEQLANE